MRRWSRGGCGTRRSLIARRCPLLLLRAAPLVRADRRWPPTPWAPCCASSPAPDRAGRAARGVHAAAHPQAGVRHPAAGAVAADCRRSCCMCSPVCSIVGAAISEIWLSLDSAGQWLFGIYGAAAAIALLGVFALLPGFRGRTAAAAAEAAQAQGETKQRRGRGKAAEDASRRRRGVESRRPTTRPLDDDRRGRRGRGRPAEPSEHDRGRARRGHRREGRAMTAEADRAAEPTSRRLRRDQRRR